MANNYAQIIGRNFHNPATGKLERTEYQWVGRSRCVYISFELADQIGWIVPEKIIKFGPYRLAILENDLMRGAYYCRHIDNIFSWLPVIWHRINRVLDIAYRRFIVTLAIWNLAEYNGAVIPHANQIYLVQKVRKLWQMIIAH
jgi:hypothetical protein